MIIRTIVKKLFYNLPAQYVLMFHHIDDGNIVYKSGCVLEYDLFLKIIDSGIECISVDEYVKFKHKNKDKCVITFDDGLKDIYTVVYPELKKRNIPFTIFIITEFLGREGYITEEELVQMSKDSLVTVGSHGLTHDIMNGMVPDKQKRELIDSKLYLENLIGNEVKYFAYSHGQYDDNTIRLMKQMKCYDFAFGVRGYPTNAYTKKKKYSLPRLNCENGNVPISFEVKSRKVKLIKNKIYKER